MAEQDRIIIVGAGPVGCITALALVQKGVPVLQLEALAETPTAHRAATTHASTLDLLDGVGMSAPVIEQSVIARHFQYRYRETNEVFAEFDFARLEGETNHPYAVQLEQHKTVAIALEMLSAHPHYTLHRLHEAVGIEQTVDHVKLTTQTPDGSQHDWHGRYVIACDGGRSFVRKSQGIDFPGFTWEERFMIVATLFDFEKADNYRYRNYIADPDRWCSVFKIPGPDGKGMWRNLFPVTENDPEDVVMSDNWIRARYDECFPYARDTEIVHRNLYTVHQRVAASFRKGRVMLAGDSAHINNPLGGMGMNSGIADGLNLAEKMVAVWRGEAGEELFDRYDRQRRPLAQKYVQAQSIQNKETLQAKDAAKATVRFEELRKTAEDPKRHKAFLMNSSLINMVREAAAID
ncbi:MAG: FAD-dependent monooxygenase [Rhodobacteraceae bacterium]|nr:FAD-dependent monooxygenase [Paracoccaceae bacterium]